MKRKKNLSDQGELPAQPEAGGAGSDAADSGVRIGGAAAPPYPTVVSPLAGYRMGEEEWRCGKFDLLAAEFENGLTPETLPLFHTALSTRERGWKIVCRLFGVRPAMPSVACDPEDLRTWERSELCERLGITGSQLNQELEAMRGAWRASYKPPERTPVKAEQQLRPTGELALEADPILKKFNFEVHFLDGGESTWFSQRVRDFEKVLQERFVTGLARNALMLELRLRRLDSVIDSMSPDKPEWRSSLKLSNDLRETYNKQIDQIIGHCPWASQIAGKFALRGALSEVTQGIQEYQSLASNKLIDGIFTTTEVEVLTRRSIQKPEPEYRAGLVLYLNMMRQGLWDPNHQGTVKDLTLRKLDRAFKAGLVAAGDESGERVPDLEADGPGGEYEDLKLPEVAKA